VGVKDGAAYLVNGRSAFSGPFQLGDRPELRRIAKEHNDQVESLVDTVDRLALLAVLPSGPDGMG
jgi:hypothetical protein